eukprot:CAMPEP_0196758384 /NCGR_PEP_ID=MMETSP1091-20130531/104159_1 /TAXON_ID=302021 /ORGANISM="Rhodomonas sp., Strain CCMP768" /LENGTH=441 /DNA_ID=CAMNT_0042107203 /DNA_START=239 /DNA_END=1564 /DNA_ORIENTATION=+
MYSSGIQLPFLGAAVQFLTDPLKMAFRAERELGDIFTIVVFGKRMTFMSGPDAQDAFCKPSDDELSQQEAYRFSVPLFGEGIVYDADLPKRKAQFKMVTNSLHTTAVANYVPFMLEEADLFFSDWPKEGTIDIYKAFSDLIIRTASRCLMGPEVRGEMFKEVSELYATLDKGCTPISFFAPYLPIPQHLARDKARRRMCAVFQRIMDQRKAKGIVGNDALQVFMDAQYADGSKNTASEVAGLMICLLFAGQHTSSVTSSWTGLYMLRDAALIKRLEAEQRAVSGPLDGAKIKSMSLLQACVSEALRLQPPLIFLMRKVLEEQTYKGITIPKDDIVFLSPSLAGRRADVFSNPNQYEPDRFLEPRSEHRKFTHGWLGFGGGRHRCLGENFAYMQIMTIWSYLLRNFELEAVGPLPQPNYEALVVGPAPPALIKYKRRSAPLI